MRETMEKEITRKELKGIINGLTKTSGFFSVLFTKKDGTLRKMVCKTGVKKYRKHNNPGIPSTTAYIPKYKTVFDVHNMGYRNINLETIQKMVINHNTFYVID